MTEPFFWKHPIDMGMDSSKTEIINTLLEKEPYKKLFQKLLISKQNKDWPFIIESITAFIKTIESKNSRYYNRFISGKKDVPDREEL